MPEAEAHTKRPRWVSLSLSLMPLWLAISAGIAVWWSIRSDDKEEEERNQRFAMEMSVERIADDIRKLDEVIGPRSPDSPDALTKAAAMIDGTLGPSNTGYQIKRIPGPDGAPVILATLGGENPDAAPFWVIASYDTPRQHHRMQIESGSVAALMAMAQAMARDQPARDIHFMFYPLGNDPESRTRELTDILLTTMRRPRSVFYLHQMGAGRDVWVSSILEPDSTELEALGELGDHSRGGMCQAAVGIQDAGMRTLCITATGPRTAEARPVGANIAVAAGKLVEWLRRADRLQSAQ